jgi:hypothetical protein
MLTPSLDILPWLAAFAPALTAPTFTNMLTLLCGTILTPGPRTVTAALRVLGLETGNFSKYHHVFNRARWSALALSRLLLLWLIRHFVPPGAPLQVLVDEHLERRKSRKLPYRGLFRDPIRSTAHRTEYSWGMRWLVFALLVPIPWCRRPWALPFLAFPLLSEKTCERLHWKHRTVTEWTAILLRRRIREWVPEREIILVGDGTYAAVPLGQACRALSHPVRLVSRLRLDAALHDEPGPRPPGKRGPKPKKGPRQPSLAVRLADPATVWERVTVPWYGGTEKTLEITSGTALWYRPSHAPLPLRWVGVRSLPGDPDPLETGACFCTDPSVSPAQIVTWFVGRWNIEATFAEVRTHLGLETQRHWCAQAAGRVIPCLFGAFSVVVGLAKILHPETLPVPQSSWYPKAEPTFADALAAVREHLWQALSPPGVRKYVTSGCEADVYLIPGALWRRLQRVVCYAT